MPRHFTPFLFAILLVALFAAPVAPAARQEAIDASFAAKLAYQYLYGGKQGKALALETLNNFSEEELRKLKGFAEKGISTPKGQFPMALSDEEAADASLAPDAPTARSSGMATVLLYENGVFKKEEKLEDLPVSMRSFPVKKTDSHGKVTTENIPPAKIEYFSIGKDKSLSEEQAAKIHITIYAANGEVLQRVYGVTKPLIGKTNK